MQLSDKRLVFAGEIAMVSAIMTIPFIVSFYILDEFPGIVPKISSTLLSLISFWFFIYTTLVFKSLLNQKFQFSKVNIYINLLILLNIIGSVMDCVYPYIKSTQTDTITWIAFAVILGLLGICGLGFGLRLQSIPHNLYGYRKPFCIANIVAGICFISVVGFPIGYIAGVVSDVYLALIFFKSAEQNIITTMPWEQ